MTDIVLSTDHDLLIENGDISLFNKVENLTVQKVKINLLLMKGEWFRDINKGVPYLQSILGVRNTKQTTMTFLRNAIINTEGITSVTSLDATIDRDRTIHVVWSGTCENGEIIENTSVEI